MPTYLSTEERERINRDCKLFFEWFDAVNFEDYLAFLLGDAAEYKHKPPQPRQPNRDSFEERHNQ